MFSFNEILSALGLLMLFLFLYYRRKRHNVVKLPGKPPNLFFGNLLDLSGPTTTYLPKLMDYSRNYGGIIKVHDGPFSIAVIVTDPKFMEYILSSTKIIDKAQQYDYFHKWLGTGLLTSGGKKWKERRRLLTPSFHFSILENFIDIFESVGEVFIKKLGEEVGKPSVDMYPLVTMCTLDIICEAAMGTPINAQENNTTEYILAVKKICRVLVDRIFSIVLPIFYPLTLNYYRENSAISILHRHTESVIDEKMKTSLKQDMNRENEDIGIRKKMAFLDMLMTYTINGRPLSRTEIREEVDTFMFEGHDTTSSAINFALYSLANNPKVQEKAYQEQIRIFNYNKDAKATYADLQNMKYLELVIKETLRLYPSVPFIGRTVPKDFKWNGVLYPKGLTIMIFNFGTQRNPEYFPEPCRFIPERFENFDGKFPYVYVPFSAGPRNCIGQKFAMLEMKSTISKVIRNFILMKSTPEHTLQLAPEIVLISKNGVRISLKHR